MNYDFLQSYTIPIARQSSDNQYVTSSHSTMDGAYETYSTQSTDTTPTVNTAYYGYGGGTNSYTGSSGGYYQNIERFIPPSKHNTGYTLYKNPYKRKLNAAGSGGSPSKKEAPIVEVTCDGKLVIFMGRDETYPDALNSLIHPLSCDLCNVKMNSRMLAKDHYESKAHDKHISAWLLKNFTEKGINPPPIKRFVKQGPTGPDAFYCESCDLKLTSLTHANQHYAGKKHRLVIAQRAKPSGAGFYNAEGKWVRTGTKVNAIQYKETRFGIGVEFTATTVSLNSSGNSPSAATNATTTSVADTTTSTLENDNSKITVARNSSYQDPALFCSICNASVTSAVQMNMHLSGSKHMKKLKLLNLEPPIDNSAESQSAIVPPQTVMDNVLFSAIKEEIKPDPSDLSMYRTPSGQYYCKTCNTSMSHLPGLEQHLQGKRHLKKLTEEKAKASLAAKKN